jgi:hypothetical protein
MLEENNPNQEKKVKLMLHLRIETITKKIVSTQDSIANST